MNPTHRVRLDLSPNGFQVPVEAKRLTDRQSIIDTSAWLEDEGVGHKVHWGEDGPFAISLHVSVGQRKAEVGDWIIRSGRFFSAATDDVLNVFYEPLEGDSAG